jgi:hypothetical protein
MADAPGTETGLDVEPTGQPANRRRKAYTPNAEL